MDSVSHGLVQQLERWMRTEQLTQVDVAERVGVSQATVSRWLQGVIPKGRARQRLAEEMGVAADQLIRMDSEAAPISPAGGVVDVCNELRSEMERFAAGIADLEFGEAAGRLSADDVAIILIALKGLRQGAEGLVAQLSESIDILDR